MKRTDRSDNYWLNTTNPCLTYGLRGINYYEIRINGPDRDLHSGVFGGTVHEPMTDLILLSESHVACSTPQAHRRAERRDVPLTYSVQARLARRQDPRARLARPGRSHHR